MEIKQRLDKLREHLHDESFLSNKGLSNEVGLYIFAYSPKDEMIVRQFTDSIRKDYADHSHPCHVVAFDLYDILMEICKEKRILDRIPQMEVQKGSDFICQQIQRMAPPEAYINHMKYSPHEKGDVVIITGIGRVYPYMRSHNILNNLQHVFDDIPVVLFYPGEYTGQSLTLFKKFTDDNYYRAFNLI